MINLYVNTTKIARDTGRFHRCDTDKTQAVLIFYIYKVSKTSLGASNTFRKGQSFYMVDSFLHFVNFVNTSTTSNFLTE